MVIDTGHCHRPNYFKTYNNHLDLQKCSRYEMKTVPATVAVTLRGHVKPRSLTMDLRTRLELAWLHVLCRRSILHTSIIL